MANPSTTPPATKALPASKVNEIFARFRAANPSPRGELNYTNPYTLLVAVTLSAQATDVGVNKATEALFQVVSHPEDMLALGEERLKDYIRTIGLYNSKARNLIRAAEILVSRFGGNVPRERHLIESLPGAGRKTANVVLNIAFGQPVIAVDTHLFRLANRTGIAPGSTALAVETALEKRIPAEYLQHAHHWLILHGRYVCKARKPECPQCIIRDLCGYAGKNLVV